jgi:hypothetical protein
MTYRERNIFFFELLLQLFAVGSDVVVEGAGHVQSRENVGDNVFAMVHLENGCCEERRERRKEGKPGKNKKRRKRRGKTQTQKLFHRQRADRRQIVFVSAVNCWLLFGMRSAKAKVSHVSRESAAGYQGLTNRKTGRANVDEEKRKTDRDETNQTFTQTGQLRVR